MSVDHRAIWAYGYVVDGTMDEMECACSKHGTMYCPVGNSYVGDVSYIITTSGLAQTVDPLDSTPFREIAVAVLPEDVEKIKATVKEITGRMPANYPKTYVGAYIF